jgi:hypothetical protein
MTTTTAPSALVSAWNDWHHEREVELAAEHGWLSLTAFHWLPAEPTTFDGLPGRWHAADGRAVWQADGSNDPETATVQEAGSLLWVRHGDAVVELVLRGGRYAIRLRDPRGPERVAFQGVPAHEVSPRWVRPGRFTPFDAPRRVMVDAARDDLRQDVTAVGTVEIAFESGSFTLVATAGRDARLNLSFRDSTSGRETAPWRVVATSAPTPTGAVIVDFNRAVNLPFAFTAFGTCPAPVPGNELPFAVTAGELAPIRVTP